MKLVTKLDYSRVLYSQDNQIHCLISATAPKIDWKSKRKPITVFIDLDISGSMAGSKLDYAKKSVMKFIDHMSAEDRLGIILFGSHVSTLFPATLMTQDVKDQMKARVQQIQALDSTNFSGAMLESLRQASQMDSTCRVIMFTDGLPNVGVQDPEGLVALLKSNISGNTSLSTFGFGDDHNSALLTQMAEVGKGSYAYIKNPDDALGAFARELGGLLSCYGQNLKFHIEPVAGVEITEVLSDVDVDEVENGIDVKFSDIYSEETKHLLVAVKLPRRPKVFPRETKILDVVLGYDDASSGKRPTVESKAKVAYVLEANVQKEVDQEVATQIGLCRVNKAQAQASVFAQQGNFMAAQSVFNNLDLSQAGAAVQAFAATSSGMYSDAMTYTSNSHNINSALYASRSGGRGQSLFTRSVGLATSNSAQEELEKAFVQPDQNNPLTAGAGGAGLPQGQVGGGFSQIQSGAQGIAGLGGLVSGSHVTLTTAAQSPLDFFTGIPVTGQPTVVAGGEEDSLSKAASVEKTEKKKLNKKRTSSQW